MTRRPIDLQFFTRYIKAFRYRNVSTFSRIACLIVSGDRTKAHPVPFTDQRSVNSILSFSFSSFFLSFSLFHPIHRDIRKIKRLENKKKKKNKMNQNRRRKSVILPVVIETASWLVDASFAGPNSRIDPAVSFENRML